MSLLKWPGGLIPRSNAKYGKCAHTPIYYTTRPSPHCSRGTEKFLFRLIRIHSNAENSILRKEQNRQT